MPAWFKDPLYLGGFAALAGLGWYVNRQDRDGGIVNVFERGNKISYGTYDPVLGLVTEPPDALRAAASVRMGIDLPIDVYSASRMVRSEGAKEGELRVHVALNDLATFRFADTLHDLLVYSTDGTRRGWYGAQYSPPVPERGYTAANRRRYATSKNSYEGDVRAALKAISDHGRGIDPSLGAVKFIDVSALSSQQGAKSLAQIKDDWGQEGLKAYTLPEYGSDLVLFRKA